MKVKHHSRKREAILAKIRSTTSHPTAEWVYRELKDEYPDLSLGTVYRNIGLFREEGEIISVGTVAGQERFDGNPLPHGHFVCEACRAVIDFDGPETHPEVTAALERLGVRAERVEMTAYGTCHQCLKNEPIGF